MRALRQIKRIALPDVQFTRRLGGKNHSERVADQLQVAAELSDELPQMAIVVERQDPAGWSGVGLGGLDASPRWNVSSRDPSTRSGDEHPEE